MLLNIPNILVNHKCAIFFLFYSHIHKYIYKKMSRKRKVNKTTKAGCFDFKSKLKDFTTKKIWHKTNNIQGHT